MLAVPGVAIAAEKANKATAARVAVAIDGMTFFRFKDGRIVEEWSTYDNLSVMQQLGMLPAK